ncbi:hypothetical protein I7I53_03245 [Histoplasma capsulatum var. duboisii H88]|uniref:Uncharacterized protein n=1 Tax=Ajellomyces capsulatus (strain H88) TaxID=544711 RepID=A0A8A1LS40_AJEC8|nr:hypothetical protein I7I53_03245 [Histoplasma capsulatum var. duboisii H88]
MSLLDQKSGDCLIMDHLSSSKLPSKGVSSCDMIRSTSGYIELDVYTILRPKPGEFCSSSSGSVANNVMEVTARCPVGVTCVFCVLINSECTG